MPTATGVFVKARVAVGPSPPTAGLGVGLRVGGADSLPDVGDGVGVGTAAEAPLTLTSPLLKVTGIISPSRVEGSHSRLPTDSLDRLRPPETG